MNFPIIKSQILKFLILLVAISSSAQPILRGPFTTNTAAVQLTTATNIATNAVTVAAGSGMTVTTNVTPGNVSYTLSTSAGGTNALYGTNGVNIGAAGTLYFDYGATGYVASGVVHLGVSISGSGDAGGTNARIHTLAGKGTNTTIYQLTVDTNLLLSHVTASRVAIIDASKQVTNSAGVSTTELEYLDGVSSAIQTQFASATNHGEAILQAATNYARTLPFQSGSFTLSNFVAMGITNIAAADSSIVLTTNNGVLNISSRAPVIVTNTVWFSAGAMAPGGGSTADGGRNGGTAGSVTNGSLAADAWLLDDTTNECVTFTFQPGYGFAGDVVTSIYWSTTNTINGASNVVWDAGVSLLASNNLLTANVYQTNGTFRFWSSNSVQVAKLPQITIASGVSPDTLLSFRLSRLGTNTSDAALGDAQLLGARISFTRTNLIGGYP